MIRINIEAETAAEAIAEMKKLIGASETVETTEAPAAPKAAAKSRAKATKAPVEPEATEEVEPAPEPEKEEAPAPEYTEADVRKRFIALQDSGPEGAKGMMDLLKELGAVNEDKLPKLKSLDAAKYGEAVEKAEALLEKIGANTSVFGE